MKKLKRQANEIGHARFRIKEARDTSDARKREIKQLKSSLSKSESKHPR